MIYKRDVFLECCLQVLVPKLEKILKLASEIIKVFKNEMYIDFFSTVSNLKDHKMINLRLP